MELWPLIGGREASGLGVWREGEEEEEAGGGGSLQCALPQSSALKAQSSSTEALYSAQRVLHRRD